MIDDYTPPDITERSDLVRDLILLNCPCGGSPSVTRDMARMEYTIRCENCGRKVYATMEYMDAMGLCLGDLVGWWNSDIRMEERCSARLR